jgi:pyruvate,water dikinase
MPSSGPVSWFADIGLQDRPRVGGKGGSLGELQRAGIAVPPGFVVTTEGFERFVEGLERESAVRSMVEALNADDLSAVTECSKRLRGRVEQAPLPTELQEALVAAYDKLAGEASGMAGPGTGATGAGGAAGPGSGASGLGGASGPRGATGPGPGGAALAVAVRSSATTEDAADASFAGLQDTYLWVRSVADMLHKVRSCWASLYSVESITYRRKRGFPEAGVAMAVVVQKMVDARTAGVMFTRSPLTGDRSVITIEGAWGLGSAVVGGEVTPDRWVLGKITGEIAVREISDKAIQHVPAAGGGVESIAVSDELRHGPCLTDEQLQALRGIGRRVERHYGRPQDIEWAVERGSGEILLLQSRPETVWSSKESQPVARAAENPLSHVMSIFGGRK